MSRPYSGTSTERLSELFNEHRHNERVVQLIQTELTHRKTKMAQRLQSEIVNTLLANIEPDKSEETTPRSSQASTKEVKKKYVVGISKIRPPGTSGLPSPYAHPLSTKVDLQLPEDADTPVRFIAALKALIAEIKKSSKGQTRYEIGKGIRRENLGETTIYTFNYVVEGELFEEAKVDILYNGKKYPGNIVSIGEGKLLIGLQEDLGPTLENVVMMIDTTALLAALVEKIEQVTKGELTLNRTLADAVVGAGKEPSATPSIPIFQTDSLEKLNTAQKKAYKRSLDADITWIWGPPGCGKTQTLREIVRTAFEHNLRVLVCSNTNKAVDQVLYRVCQSLGIDHPSMEKGEVVRLGRVADEKLEQEFKDYVTVEGIAERKAAELVARKAVLEEEIQQVEASLSGSRRILIHFEELAALSAQQEDFRKKLDTVTKEGFSFQAKTKQSTEILTKLQKEFAERNTGLLKFLKRSEEQIQADIQREDSQLQIFKTRLDDIAQTYRQIESAWKDITTRVTAKQESLHGLNKQNAQETIDKGEQAQEKYRSEISDIDAKIAAIRQTVIQGAKIIGATCTKSFLSVKDLGSIDMVIVDEASMIMLPHVWFVAGIAKQKVVICGDFSQIPPIVQGNEKAILDVLKHDAFTASNVRNDTKRLMMLDTQYRMDDAICQLISEPMYKGELKTALNREAGGTCMPEPFNTSLLIVDTSELYPTEAKTPSGSRFNLMHALLGRNIAWYFEKEGSLTSNKEFGICTPFKAQADLLKKILETEQLDNKVAVGTVHRYQGDERRVMLLDIVESFNERSIGIATQGLPPESEGARQINVAISRAQDQLIVLANLSHLDEKLPSGSLMRQVLYRMQEQGKVISGKDVLKLRPIEKDLEGLLGEVELEEINTSLALFNERTFETALKSDIAHAQSTVVIFSAFITSKRIATLVDSMRAKIAQGVKIRCVTRPPDKNGSIPEEDGRKAVAMLQEAGVVVDCRAQIHEKVCLIDNKIVWMGSLNALSYNTESNEMMTRVVSASIAKVIASQLALTPTTPDKINDNVAAAENPPCTNCGRRSVYIDGKHGAFFACEAPKAECGWTENTGYKKAQPKVSSDPQTAQSQSSKKCPKCKSSMQLRSGRYGQFYSCSKYPKCDGKLKIS